MSTARRLGILGGTFDPPHIGHLVTANEVQHQLDLDEVWMVVANEPWQKVGTRELSSASDRFDMVAAAVADDDAVSASDIEIRRGGPSYSIDTLGELQEQDPDRELYLIVGSDAAAGLDTWERASSIGELCRIVVVERPGVHSAVPDGFEALHVEVPRLDVSSTELRARVRSGRSLRHLVPPSVIALIAERGLYGDPR